jgi:beta-galactosidase
MVTEAVGQFNYAERKGFDAKYRRAGDVSLQQVQALRHAQAHDKGMSLPRCSGVIAWCAFDYSSLINAYAGVKCPGVSDVFRIPKLGASFYEAQVDPKIRPVIKPNFYWEFGPRTPHGPGKNATIFSNCDRLGLFIDGKQFAMLRPDRRNYAQVKYPPFVCDLDIEGAAAPGLRIDGYVGDTLALSKSFSSDTTKDQFILEADDTELIGDGSDATRLVFTTADQFGATRPFADGEVRFALIGPGVIVGDNPFRLTDSGGVGAIWIKTSPKSSGRTTVEATHSLLGTKSIEINVTA